MASKRSASVVWELSEEGRVVVDVDVPLRPFGGIHSDGLHSDGRTATPAKGILLPKDDETEPDGAAVVDRGAAIAVAIPVKKP
ncbi:MAG TPA: hypothetical protein VGO62_22005 [Myxococcota bacterium]|jgi:hypothetical protein